MTPCYTRHETAPGTHADIPHEHERLDMSTYRDELEVKVRWASKKSLTAEQARDVADTLISAGYFKWNPEAVGEVEVIAPNTSRVGEVISHKGNRYVREAAL